VQEPRNRNDFSAYPPAYPAIRRPARGRQVIGSASGQRSGAPQSSESGSPATTICPARRDHPWAPEASRMTTLRGTGPLVAAIDRSGTHHAPQRRPPGIRGWPLADPPAVIVEACWLAEERPDIDAAFLTSIAAGEFEHVTITATEPGAHGGARAHLRRPAARRGRCLSHRGSRATETHQRCYLGPTRYGQRLFLIGTIGRLWSEHLLDNFGQAAHREMLGLWASSTRSARRASSSCAGCGIQAGEPELRKRPLRQRFFLSGCNQ
jgi:hypothetical protein